MDILYSLTEYNVSKMFESDQNFFNFLGLVRKFINLFRGLALSPVGIPDPLPATTEIRLLGACYKDSGN